MWANIKLVRVVVDVCEMCLKERVDGQEEECHTPGCFFWMQDAPEGAALALLRGGMP